MSSGRFSIIFHRTPPGRCSTPCPACKHTKFCGHGLVARQYENPFAPVVPLRPMSRWFFILLLACASAQAAPDTTPASEMDGALHQQRLLSQFVEIRQSVAVQAHEVVDRTSDLVVTAMGFLGVPYRRGGNSAETGFDCSGFVRAMYEKTAGLLLPRRADQQAAFAEKIDKKDLQPGDLVFFNTMRRAFSHVGIYVGDGKFIHSPRSGSEVRVDDMQQSYWKRRFDGARRVSPPAATAPVQTAQQ